MLLDYGPYYLGIKKKFETHCIMRDQLVIDLYMRINKYQRADGPNYVMRLKMWFKYLFKLI